MDAEYRLKLQNWVEKKYLTKTVVEEGSASVHIDESITKSYVSGTGTSIHTDGIVERNNRDFGVSVISGYNYVVICRYGKAFNGISEPRIIIYTRDSSKWSYLKFKWTVKRILKMYK
jgi:hypothetical protein